MSRNTDRREIFEEYRRARTRLARLGFTLTYAEFCNSYAERTKSPLSDQDEKGKKICRLRAIGPRGQFDFFLRHYFPHYFTVAFGQPQRELIRDIQKLRGRERDPRKLLRAMPRGYGKSSIMSLCAVLWLILTGTWQFVVMISSTLPSSKGFLRKVIEEIDDNELLRQDFPELLPKMDRKGHFVSWNDSDIVLGNGARIISKGFLNAIRGTRNKSFRPDALIVDDPDEEAHVRSESKMRAKYRWFDRAALKLGSYWGLDVLFAYTTISANCVGEVVYNDSRYSNWDRKKYKALEVDENGQEYSTWPEWAPLELLLLERDGDGTLENPGDKLTFAQERQNEVLAEADQQFKGLIQTYRFRPLDDWVGYRFALGVDSSLGKTDTSSYSAIVGACLSPEGVLYEVYNSIVRRRTDQLLDDLMNVLQIFPWEICNIDTAGNQEHFLDRVQDRIKLFNQLTTAKIIIPLNGVAGQDDKIRRITGALQPLVAAGLLKIRETSELLFRQLDEFPHGYKDGPDALEYAVRPLLKPPTNVKVFVPDVRKIRVGVTGEELMRRRFQRYGIRRS